MIYIEKDKLNIDDFIVYDEDDNPITGLELSDFVISLFDPDKLEIVSGIYIDEVEDGLYRISFTPNKLGNWSLIIYNSTYFPYGKGQNYRCVDSLGGITPETDEIIRRILGLSQENYRIINPQYDTRSNLIGGIIKIYPTAADVETDTNSIASYEIIAEFKAQNHLMSSYKVKKL